MELEYGTVVADCEGGEGGVMKPIPIAAGQRIAKLYDYDQVIIIARKVGEHGGEHVTTYGKNPVHCDIAARCGDFIKYRIMGWPLEPPKEA